MERTARRSQPQDGTFIVLGSDSRHVLLGRHGEPDAAEAGQIAALLAARNLGGWVAVMRGDYWRRDRALRLELVREAAPSPITFEQAASAFHAKRLDALPPDRSPGLNGRRKRPNSGAATPLPGLTINPNERVTANG